MNQKDITKLLDANPFIPFRIYLTDGKIYDIHHRESPFPSLSSVLKKEGADCATAPPTRNRHDWLSLSPRQWTSSRNVESAAIRPSTDCCRVDLRQFDSRFLRIAYC